MTPIYAAKLGFVIRKTDVGIRKIDSSVLVIHRMTTAGFLFPDKLRKVQFFGILGLTFFDVDKWFAEKEFVWRSYTTAKVLKREFAAATLDDNKEIFVMHY